VRERKGRCERPDYSVIISDEVSGGGAQLGPSLGPG
jgi:hypothetical protein